MISSEVQRTLVKSPPELWAELSDPDALARHLGELGQIRITRVEPERKVEWEAEGTKGIVQIKASGWGTKVTLSVNRELAPVVEDAPAAEEAPAVVEDEPSVEDQPAPEQPATLESAPGLDGAPAAEALPAAAAIEPMEPLAVQAPVPWAPTAEAPVLWAPASEVPVPLAPARVDGAPAPWAPAAVEEALTREETPEPEAAPARRRGFFARLFGRREPAPAADQASIQPSAKVDPAPAPAPARSDAAEAPKPLTASSPAPAPEPPPLEPQTGHAAGEPIPRAAERAVESGELAPSAAVAEPAPSASVAEPESAEVEPVGVAAEPGSGGRPEGPSEELRLAEEVAAEEVTAVLVAVLDRLGAAHHRPFSRS